MIYLVGSGKSSQVLKIPIRDLKKYGTVIGVNRMASTIPCDYVVSGDPSFLEPRASEWGRYGDRANIPAGWKKLLPEAREWKKGEEILMSVAPMKCSGVFAVGVAAKLASELSEPKIMLIGFDLDKRNETCLHDNPTQRGFREEIIQAFGNLKSWYNQYAEIVNSNPQSSIMAFPHEKFA